MDTNNKKYFKFSLALIVCLLARLIPFRAPNVEPILAATMPFSKAYGALFGFFFAVLSILLYDALTETLGAQTFFTAGAFGILGVWSASYFKKNKANAWNYARFAIFVFRCVDRADGRSDFFPSVVYRILPRPDSIHGAAPPRQYRFRSGSFSRDL